MNLTIAIFILAEKSSKMFYCIILVFFYFDLQMKVTFSNLIVCFIITDANQKIR